MKGAKIRGKEHVFISRVGWFSTVVCVDKAEKRDVTFQQRDGAACPITKRKTIGHLTLQKHSSYVRLWWFGLFHLCCWWPCWYWLLTWWQKCPAGWGWCCDSTNKLRWNRTPRQQQVSPFQANLLRLTIFQMFFFLCRSKNPWLLHRGCPIDPVSDRRYLLFGRFAPSEGLSQISILRIWVSHCLKLAL